MNRNNHTNAHPAVVKQQYDTHNVWEFENQWRQKLCDCKPMSRCCFTCFCSCCMGCKLAKYLGESQAVGCCLPCSLRYFRTKLRTARRIEGSCCGDCCSTSFCPCCAATQLAGELESQGLWDQPKGRKTHPKNDRQPQNGYARDDYN